MRLANRVLCLPGFADPIVGERWVAELAAALPDVAVDTVEWPGLWTRAAEPVSFAAFVAEVAERVDGRTVVVGHSLGGRVALQLACDGPRPAAVAALCSPARLAINDEPSATEWRRGGARPTHRVAVDGTPHTLEIPAAFLDELDAWDRGPRIPDVRTLMVFGGADERAAAREWGDSPQPRTITIPECAHRFMDDDIHRALVVDAVAAFVGRT